MLPKILMACRMPESFFAGAGKFSKIVPCPPLLEGVLPATLDAVVILVRSESRVTKSHLMVMPSLRAVIRVGTGTDNIDTAAAQSLGVEVIAFPGTNSDDVAELACGLLIMLARRLWCISPAGIVESDPDGMSPLGTRLCGRSLGILGCGSVGTRIGAIANAMGMDVLGSVAGDTPLRRQQMLSRGIRIMDPDLVINGADDLIVSLPSAQATRGMLNAERVSRLKDRASVVVVGRIDTVDLAALLDRLSAGKLRGVAIDANEAELPVSRPDGFVSTPHIGAMTREAREALSDAVLDKLRTLLSLDPMNP